jgi:hypothetical protein
MMLFSCSFGSTSPSIPSPDIHHPLPSIRLPISTPFSICQNSERKIGDWRERENKIRFVHFILFYFAKKKNKESSFKIETRVTGQALLVVTATVRKKSKRTKTKRQRAGNDIQSDDRRPASF